MRSELDANLKEAIKSQEKQRVATLRLINAAIKDRDIAVRSEENTEGVSDAEIILILSNMVKQRKQSIILFWKEEVTKDNIVLPVLICP